MKQSLFAAVWLACLSLNIFAQANETFDIATFQAPKGWTKQSGQDGIQFSIAENDSFCLITLFRSVPGLSSPKENFDAAWSTIVKEAVTVTAAPQMFPSDPRGQWQISGGFAPFEKDGSKGVAVLYTASGFGRMMNALVLTNTQQFEPEATAFLASISFKQPADANVAPKSTGQVTQPHSARKSGFKYTENRFNDGWTAIEQEDWVRATRGSATVLIHYELPDLRPFNNLDEKSTFVWDKIVAPRYRDLKNFYARRGWYTDGDSMNGKYFVSGDVTDPSTGKRAYVALYKDGNAGKWIEFIMPDKRFFESTFTPVFDQDGTNWAKLSAMIGYNKFAVAPEDIPGVWRSSSAAGVDLYNIYTGDSLGMATSSSTNEFTFVANGGYSENYKSASGVGAGLSYYGQTNKGRYSVSSSSMLTLTNRFKGQAHEFAAYFEAVKGGRILHLIRGSIEDLHLYKVR